jgi:putative phosphoribosyl transferase
VSTVRLPAGRADIFGDLDVPEGTRGLVVFAHGSGSGRHSPRNQYVASLLRRRALGTLLLDLLTVDEEAEDRQSGLLRFDIGLLAGRLVDVNRWAAAQPETAGLSLGYFGASTGAAAALLAAAEEPDRVAAVVSRGGRPDLAGARLAEVRAPTLLIVGERDREVLALNRAALDELRVDKELCVIPGASHLFEEPGALDEVGRLAAEWFARYS